MSSLPISTKEGAEDSGSGVFESSYARFIANRYLWSKRSEAFITFITGISVLGVAIGVMVLCIVMAVMAGFQTELRKKLTDANAHITVRSMTGKLPYYETFAGTIRTIPGVESAEGYIQAQVLARYQDRTNGILLRGVSGKLVTQLSGYLQDGEDANKLLQTNVVMDDPETGTATELPPIIVGRELARTFNLSVGSILSVVSPQVGSTPFGLVPRFKRFAVSAIYSSGLTDYESALAYISLDRAQQFFSLSNSVTGIEIRTTNPNDAPAIGKQVHQVFANERGQYFVQDWTEANKPLWEALKLEQRVYFIVLLLIIVMASFSIITSLVMLVLEKRKDIAVLRTLGASGHGIWKIFFIQGSTIGILGTALGLVLGVLGSWGLREYGFPLDEKVFQMSTVPVYIQPENFLLVGVCSCVICCVATLYPARKASRLSPSELLRSE